MNTKEIELTKQSPKKIANVIFLAAYRPSLGREVFSCYSVEDDGVASEQGFANSNVIPFPGSPDLKTVDTTAAKTSVHAFSKAVKLRGVVYTESDIGIFWESAALKGQGRLPFIVGYRICRDGILQTTVNGPSFYQSNLAPSTKYEYSVAPIGCDGTVGAIAKVFLITGEPTPHIADSNEQDVLLSITGSDSHGSWVQFNATSAT